MAYIPMDKSRGFTPLFGKSYRDILQLPFLPLVSVVRSRALRVLPIPLSRSLTLLFSVGGVVPTILIVRSSRLSGLPAGLCKPVPPAGVFVAGPLALFPAEVACHLPSINQNLPHKWRVSGSDNAFPTSVACAEKR